MASLHIVVGYDGPGASAKPSLVYLGRSGSESAAALAASNFPRHEIFKNLVGIRKHNSKFSAPAAAADVDSDSDGSEVPAGDAPPPAQA